MQTRLYFTVILLTLCELVYSFPQNETDSLKVFQENKDQESLISIDSISDTEIDKKPLLIDLVRYKAKDYVRIDQNEKKLYLYDNAELYYQDIELKAGIIILDYSINEVMAGRIPDSLGKLSQYPYFKQGANEVNPDSLRYNFDTQKALIWNSKSEQSGMNVFASYTKKENDSVYYLKDAKVTTGGDFDTTDYYFRIRKGKLVPGGKIVTGFTNMYIADVPTPIALPFAYFPSSQKQQSGFLFPTIGESNNRGYYLQNGGYYLPISDFIDLAILGDYYTNGSYGYRMDSKYIKRYKYAGNFSFRYENLIDGERGLPNYSKSTVFNLRWSHSKDSRSSPKSNFSASVNFGSSDYFRQSVNQLNTANFLNNNLSSSISYSRNVSNNPRISASISANLSQNSQTKNVNLTLPSFQANMERIYPFAKKNGSGKGLIRNINFQYSTQAINTIITTEDELFSKSMFENAKYGMQHLIPLSTNFKVFKYFSVSVGGNYKEVWTPNTIKYNDYNETSGIASKETINKFDAFRTYSYSASVGTTVYGIVNFKETSKIQSIRHTLRPSISYSTIPSFDQYYDTYIIDANGNTQEYTRFEEVLYGSPANYKAQSIGISLSNNLEAKVLDSLGSEPRKIKLFNNLNLSTGYNILANQFKWSPVRMTTGFDIFEGVTLNVGATFDPYALDENNQRINKFNIERGGGLLRLTSGNLNTSYKFSSKDFDDGNADEEIEYSESTSGGGRSDNLFGDNMDIDGPIERSNKPVSTYPSYRTKIPWEFNLAYSLTYRNDTRQNDFATNSLMFSGDIDLTPKWKIGMSSGYDFKNKGFTYTQFRFDRDLDSWALNFSWVPFSDRASWNFFIGIKSGLLSDIKYDKQREPDRNYSNPSIF